MKPNKLVKSLLFASITALIGFICVSLPIYATIEFGLAVGFIVTFCVIVGLLTFINTYVFND